MTGCPASVRIAVPTDSDALFSFVWEAHEETRYAPKDDDKIRSTIAHATSVRRNPVFGIIRGSAGIEGAVGLAFDTWWFSSHPILMSFFFFVHPEHRRSNHAADLRAFAGWFAAQIGMPLVLVDWSPQETGKTRLFAKHGERVCSMFSQGLAA